MKEILLAKASALKKMKENKAIFKLGLSGLLFVLFLLYILYNFELSIKPKILMYYISGLIVYPFFASYLYCVSKEKLKFKRLFSFWSIKQLSRLIIIYTIISVPLLITYDRFRYFNQFSWRKLTALILLFVAFLIEELLELTTYVYVNYHKSGSFNAIKKSFKIYFKNFFKIMLLKFSFYVWYLLPLSLSLMSEYIIFFAIWPIITIIISIFYFPYYVTAKTEYYSKLMQLT